MHFVFAALFAAFVPMSVSAQEIPETGLNQITTTYDARGWEAVGRLNIGVGGMCTGALISSRVVLTAGHCAFNSHTGQLVDPSEITFHAGWRNGHSAASRKVRRIVVHPEYQFAGAVNVPGAVQNDLALFELEDDILLANVEPFETAKRPRKGQQVGVVSYAHDRAETASIEEACHVLARQRGSLILSCSVDFGSSGAPIFVQTEEGARIVSVVSAKAEVRGRPVSLGTNLEKPLTEMLAVLNGGGGYVEAPKITIMRPNEPRRLSSGGTGGAKFLRP